jgi:two-component system nitrogen regulation response regulator NtrX
MQQSALISGVAPRKMSRDAIAAFQACDWPGNVRQLRNVVDWILIMAPGQPEEPVTVDHLPPDIGVGTPAPQGWEEGAKMMALPLRDAVKISNVSIYLHKYPDLAEMCRGRRSSWVWSVRALHPET